MSTEQIIDVEVRVVRTQVATFTYEQRLGFINPKDAEREAHGQAAQIPSEALAAMEDSLTWTTISVTKGEISTDVAYTEE